MYINDTFTRVVPEMGVKRVLWIIKSIAQYYPKYFEALSAEDYIPVVLHCCLTEPPCHSGV